MQSFHLICALRKISSDHIRPPVHPHASPHSANHRMSWSSWDDGEVFKNHFEQVSLKMLSSNYYYYYCHSSKLPRAQGVYTCSKCGYELFPSVTKFKHSSPWVRSSILRIFFSFDDISCCLFIAFDCPMCSLPSLRRATPRVCPSARSPHTPTAWHAASAATPWVTRYDR